MHTSLFLERADTYVSAQWRESRSPWAQAPRGPFVTISRQAGSGGASLARLLVRKLNGEATNDISWSIFDGNLTPQMLRTNHLPPRLARYLPEDRVPEINASIGELVGLHPNLWDLVQKTNETMRQLATRGHAIFVGRGANFATKDIPHGVHVRLVAAPAHRARYLAQLYNIPEAEAATQNARCDVARRRYVQTHFNARDDDPGAYDLTINTERLSLAEAAQLIVEQVRARVPHG